MHHLLNTLFLIKRRTGFVFDKAVLSAATAADRTPDTSYMVEVEVVWDGSGTAGTVTCAGTSGGGAASEALSFANILTVSGTGRLTTMTRFDASTAVTFTPSGWTENPTVTVRGVRQDGSPLKLLYTEQASWPGRIDRRKGSWGLPTDGSVQIEAPIVFLAYSSQYVPREGDELTEITSSRVWRIEGEPLYDAAVAPHHWEANVQRQET